MLKFGLIGYPIAHSLSPELYRREFGTECRFDLIETPDFNKAWNAFLGGYDAVNVTAPFKSEAYFHSDIRSSECEASDAANLLVSGRAGGGVRAFNTDVLAARRLFLETDARKVLVVGAGGAGRSAAAAAKMLGIDCTLCNRTPGEGIAPLEKSPFLAQDCDTIVYSVPVKLEHTDSFAGKTVIEPNYRDPHLLDLECRYVAGEQWLRYQAEEGFSILRKWVLKDTIALLGFMGSGKTTVGKALATAIGAAFYDLDEMVQRKAGARIPEIFAAKGESAFRELEYACLKEVVSAKGKKVIAFGGGTLLAPHCTDLLGRGVLRIYLKASAECVLEHLGGDWDAASAVRPLLAKVNPCELLRSRSVIYEANADLTVDVDTKDVPFLVDEMVSHY